MRPLAGGVAPPICMVELIVDGREIALAGCYSPVGKVGQPCEKAKESVAPPRRLKVNWTPEPPDSGGQ